MRTRVFVMSISTTTTTAKKAPARNATTVYRARGGPEGAAGSVAGPMTFTLLTSMASRATSSVVAARALATMATD